MIEFITKEPRLDTCGVWVVPTYMVRRGNEHFVYNQFLADVLTGSDNPEFTRIKKELDENDGAYFSVEPSCFGSPIDVVLRAAKTEHDFEECGWLILDILPERFRGHVFSGDYGDLPTSFCFHIFDFDLATKIDATLGLLDDKKFEEVLCQVGNESFGN